MRFHEFKFQTEPESFIFLSSKTKKSFIPKKKFFGSTAKIQPKDGVSRLNLPEGFDLSHIKYRHLLTIYQTKISCKKIRFYLIRPMAVARPVPITTPMALPAATLVPEKTMFFLSWLTDLK